MGSWWAQGGLIGEGRSFRWRKRKGFQDCKKNASKGTGRSRSLAGWGEMGDTKEGPGSQKTLNRLPKEGRGGGEKEGERRGLRAALRGRSPPPALWQQLQKHTLGEPHSEPLSPQPPILGLLTNMKLRLENRLVAKPHPIVLFFQGLSPPSSWLSGCPFSALLQAGVLPPWGD